MIMKNAQRRFMKMTIIRKLNLINEPPVDIRICYGVRSKHHRNEEEKEIAFISL